MGQEIKWDRIALYVLVSAIVLYGIYTYSNYVQNKVTPPPTPAVIQQIDDDKKDADVQQTQVVKDYKDKTTNRTTKNKKQNDKANQDIKLIPSLDRRERDSIWSILLNSKDSLPTRYWDLLEQRARRKSPGDF
jgi:hypothetical protein